MTTEAPPCVHHERGETPHGTEMVKSRCILCGYEREYPAAHKYNFNVKETLNSVPVKQERVWDD